MILPRQRSVGEHFFVLPSTFDPLHFLPARLHRRADDARYFVSTVLTKLAYRDVDNSGFVRLHSTLLRDVMNWHDCAAVIDSLVESEAVEQFPYAAGVRSYGYRLGKRFVADRHVRRPVTDARLLERLRRATEKAKAESSKRMRPVHHELAKRQYRLGIDVDQANELLKLIPEGSNPFDAQGILVGNIARREFRLSVGEHGRVSNSITSLKRTLRQALRVDGESLHSVDLSCVQPALVAERIRHTTTTHDAACINVGRSDISLYTNLVQQGELYDVLASETGLSRDVVKRHVLRDVIAKNGNYPSIVEDAFRRLFPSVFDWIKFVNRTDHGNLIRLLQLAESSLVIEGVAADLLERHPDEVFLTLHDSIFCLERNIPHVVRAFERGFEAIDFRMRYKVAAA